MKPLLRLAVLVLFVSVYSSASAQIRKIPAEVTDAFTGKYPQATSVEWRDKLSGFTATFMLDSATHIASFNNKGTWENTEISINEDELPSAVQDGFDKSKYAEWNVSETSRIEFPDEPQQYKVAVEKSDLKKRNLYFNEEGRLLRDKITL